MYRRNIIDKLEYKKNTKILIKTIKGRFNLSNKQLELIHGIVKQNLNVTKLKLCMSMLQINFN